MVAWSRLTAQEWNRFFMFHEALKDCLFLIMCNQCIWEEQNFKAIVNTSITVLRPWGWPVQVWWEFFLPSPPYSYIIIFWSPKCLFKKSEFLFRLRRGRRLPWGEVLHLRQPHVPVLEIVVSGQRNTLPKAPHTWGKCQPYVPVLDIIVSAKEKHCQRTSNQY